MKTTGIRRAAVLLTVSVLGTVLAAAPAAADDHHPFTGEEQLEACANELNSPNGLPVDVNMPAQSHSELVPSFNDANQSVCWNFGWAEINAPAAPFTVIPEFAGPNITSSGWDCNHSTVFYGIYGQTSWGQWVYLRGGLMYGNLANGACGHAVSNFPSQASWARNQWTQWGGGKFRIGMASWSHDDPAIGHHNDFCADPKNCYWNTLLRILVG
jgi:hypothetical protein